MVRKLAFLGHDKVNCRAVLAKVFMHSKIVGIQKAWRKVKDVCKLRLWYHFQSYVWRSEVFEVGQKALCSREVEAFWCGKGAFPDNVRCFEVDKYVEVPSHVPYLRGSCQCYTPKKRLGVAGARKI